MASINFQNALGIHPKAMLLRATRAEVLANNLANADTPQFKARDINFQAMLKGELQQGQSLPLERTHSGHLQGQADSAQELQYRNPFQPSVDGNTVDSQVEQTIFARNAMGYNASFEFLSSKFSGLKGAIRGE